MSKSRYLALAILATGTAAQAQTIPPTLPTAGNQLQQLPQPPVTEKSAPELDFDRGTPAADAVESGVTIHVSALDVTGETAFAKADLLAATGFVPGSDMTLTQLRALAARISDYYHDRGFFLAHAYLPAQDVADGVVTIAVVEGRYGEITLRNEADISDAVLTRRLRGLDAQGLIVNAPLERRLLLLSDIPGVRIKGTLAPGTAVGSSDLIVTVTPGPRITGNLEADNGGGRYTGTYRFGGSINLDNPLGIGDRLTLRALASDGGLAYGRVAYQAPVGNATLGVAYAHLRYTLGREFEALDGSGTADIFSLTGSYPLIRSRRANLTALASADYKLLHDDIGVVSSFSDKRIKAATLSLAGDARDTLGGGGWTIFALGWTTGELDIRSAAERAVDAITARSAGGYNKLLASVSREQSVAGPLSLLASVRGQYAFDNLDSSEKMQLGGAYGVRAYPEGEAFGDSGYIATAEAHLQLGGDPARLPGRFELTGFVETGAVRYAQDPWFTGPNKAHRSGYGVGLNWAGPQRLLIRTSYARKLGTGPATSAPDRSGRFWIQVVKSF